MMSICISQNIDERIYTQLSKLSTKTNADLLITEYQSFISMFPNSSFQKHANFNLAEVYYQERKYLRAFALYLRSSVLYRGYQNETILLKLKSIVENYESRLLTDKRELIQNTLAYISTGNLIDDLLKYIHAMDELNSEYFFQDIIQNGRLFIQLFPQSINNDVVSSMIANAYQREGEHTHAILYYSRVHSFFEDSELQDDALYNIAKIYQNDLDKYPEAIKTYSSLIDTFPTSAYAPKSLFHIAEINEKELENKFEAIQYYTKMIKQYPQDSTSVDALFRIASLYDDENSFNQSIPVYKRIITEYKHSRKAPNAQMKLIRIYKKELNDIVNAIREMRFFSETFPQHEEAAYYLLEAGDLSLDELKNEDEALAIYKEVIANFNGTDYASRAESRIDDLKR